MGPAGIAIFGKTGSAEKAAYEIKDGTLCFDYDGSFDDWCAWISRDGDNLEFVNESSNLQTGNIGTQLLPGQQ